MAKPLAKLLSMLTPKRRWAQFSLRTLLGLTAAICLLLGGLHLLQTYGNRIEVDEVTVGEPFNVNVRYVRLFGPEVSNVFIRVYDGEYYGENGCLGYSMYDNANRTWLCFYTHEFQCYPVKKPCKLTIELLEFISFPPGGEHSGQNKFIKRRTMEVK